MLVVVLPFIAVCFLALAVTSWRFYTRAPAGSHPPMQWGFDGKPTWRAPRLVAALFTPTIAVIVVLTSLVRGIDAAAAQSAVGFTALLFAIIHAAHAHFALRDVLGPNGP